jgi:tRNA (guanosine-2'-O-)-methyltransferase
VEVDRIAPADLARIVELLESHITPARRQRIETVVASRTREVVLVLEDLVNEHNASAVLRSAEAFGFFELHAIESGEVPFLISSKISRGAHKWLDFRRHQGAEHAYAELKERGYAIWASDIHGAAIDVHEIDISRKVALVFGNEHAGLSRVAAEAADGRFKIPMAGFVESFNVSVAAAVSAYDLMIRRKQAGRHAGLPPEERLGVHAAFLARSVKASDAILARLGLPVPVLSLDAPSGSQIRPDDEPVV